MRLLLGRALGVFLGALAIAYMVSVIDGFRYTSGFAQISVIVLQLVASPLAALAGHWLWRRDRRAIAVTGLTCGLGSVAGTLAAWIYTPAGPERNAAAFGALGGGIVFTIAVVLLARIALRTPTPTPEPATPF